MKWRLFCHLLHGGFPDAERLYRWHIETRSGHRMKAGIATDKWKKTTSDYVQSATYLFNGMRTSWRIAPIPIDPNGELLDGSHRVACALALGIEDVPVSHEARYVWAPPWGEQWFRDHGMDGEELERLRQDFLTISK